MNNVLLVVGLYVCGIPLAYRNYASMLAIREEESTNGESVFIVDLYKLLPCTILWPLVEVVSATYDLYKKVVS